MDAMQAIGAALDDLYKLQMARANCNGWRNLAELFRVFGEFAEDNLDEVVSYLNEAIESVRHLEKENTELRARLVELKSEVERFKQKSERLERFVNATL